MYTTALNSGERVSKSDPRIQFRGSLDGLIARLLLLISAPEGRLGGSLLRRGAEELLGGAQALFAAEVKQELPAEWRCLGFSEEELHRISHRPKQFFGRGHLLPKSGHPTSLLELNRLRTEVRTLELEATRAAEARPENRVWQAICRRLNRMSSAVYTLMLIRGEEEEMQEAEIAAVVEKVQAILAGESRESSCDSREVRGEGGGESLGDLPLEVSARHVHLSKEHMDTLFGGGLRTKRELSQPGQFLAEERVRLIGPKGMIENVAVLGPARRESQAELSATDAARLGIAAPVRQSGDLEDSPGFFIAAGEKMVRSARGAIIAARHIHLDPEGAKRLSLHDGERVDAQIGGERSLTFRNVLVRVNPDFRPAMHIDYDEANACGYAKGMGARILKSADLGASGTVEGPAPATVDEHADSVRVERRLLSEREVTDAANKGVKRLILSAGGIVTPLARDAARGRGIEIVRGGADDNR